MKDAIGILPPEVMRFIQERIDSVPELETLLMMSEDPRPWSAAEISRRVYVPRERAEAILETLMRQKLVAPVATAGVFEFRPADDRERDLTRRTLVTSRCPRKQKDE